MSTKGLKILIHASTWFAPVLVPLIIYLVINDRDVKRLSLQALFFHFVMGFLLFISYLFSWVLIGIPFLIIFSLIALIAPIMGIICAIKDRHFNYPIIGRFIR